MKIQVRNGVFETNSSSIHSITMCSESDYEKWKNGEIYYSDDAEELYDKQKIISELKNCVVYEHIDWSVDWKTNPEIKNILYNNRFFTYEEFFDRYYETFTETHTTDSGEVIHAFGYYGYE